MEPTSTQPKRILIIEDEEALSEVEAETLREQGYEVTVCTDGQEGLKKALEMRPDLILLDIIMPKLNGLDMFKQLRKEQKPPITPVIFFTNLNQLEKIAEALQEGANTYLIKADTTLDLIVEKVKEFFEKHK